LNYLFGSVNSSTENSWIAIPEMNWLGFSKLLLDSIYNISSKSIMKMNDKDYSKLNSILKRQYFDFNGKEAL